LPSAPNGVRRPEGKRFGRKPSLEEEEGSGMDLFSVTVILPGQFQAIRDGQRAAGERAMVAAFFEGARKELTSPKARIRSEAELWFLDGDLGMFTARECCEYLNLDYVLVRASVVRALANKLGGGMNGKEAISERRSQAEGEAACPDSPFGAEPSEDGGDLGRRPPTRLLGAPADSS
jgi:hypothetical protein